MLLDDADTNSIKPTKLDIERINSMQIGDKIDGELGNWSLLRYKNDFVLLLKNSVKYKDFIEFKDSKKLINFLESK